MSGISVSLSRSICNGYYILSFQSHPPDFREAMLQDLTKYISKDRDYAIARGRFGETWKYSYQIYWSSIKVRLQCLFCLVVKLKIQQVAIKSVLIHASDQQSDNKYEECHVRWSF